MGGFLTGMLSGQAADLQGGGGLLSGLGDLFKNKLFLQYLSSAGGAMSNGQPVGGALNNVTQQQIQNTNYVDMLSKILGGKNPGTSAKIDDKGLTINMARETPVGVPGPDPGTTGIPKMMDSPMTPPVKSSNPAGVDVNPFVSGLPNFSASELAGLTPELITQALGFKANQEQSALEAEYKKKVMQQIDSQIQQDRDQAEIAKIKAEKIDPLDELNPIEVPGIGQLTNRQWNALPKEEQLYSIYAKTKDPKDRLLSRDEFRNMDPGAQEKFLRSLMKDPALKKFAMEFEKLKSTTINLSPFDQTTQRNQANAISDALSPEFETRVMKDYDVFSDPRYKKLKAQGISHSEAKTRAARLAAISKIDEALSQAYKNIGKTVTTDNKTGWFVDGKMVRAFPK